VKYKSILNTWVKAYHGTRYEYLKSIMEIGLKKPGEKDKSGSVIRE